MRQRRREVQQLAGADHRAPQAVVPVGEVDADRAAQVAPLQHGPAEAAILAERLEIPIRTLRQRHMAERLQARYGIRRQRRNGRVMFLITASIAC